MLQTQARAAGLELNLASPASPTLFPRPALDLDGITLNAKAPTHRSCWPRAASWRCRGTPCSAAPP